MKLPVMLARFMLSIGKLPKDFNAALRFVRLELIGRFNFLKLAMREMVLVPKHGTDPLGCRGIDGLMQSILLSELSFQHSWCFSRAFAFAHNLASKNCCHALPSPPSSFNRFCGTLRRLSRYHSCAGMLCHRSGAVVPAAPFQMADQPAL